MTELTDMNAVVSLACARTEEALAEGGPLDPQSSKHLQSCAQCQELAELIGDGGAIAAATAPVALPAGFVDSVLDRALSETHPLDRIRPATDDLRVAELEAALEARRRRTAWVAAAALVAGLLVAAGAYNVWGPASSDTVTSQPTAQARPVAAPTRPDQPRNTVAPPPGPHTAKPLAPKPELPVNAAAGNPTPETPETIPEPVVNVPAEIRATVLRKIRQHDACPKRNRTPVRLTLTIGEDGRVSSPQVLSASGNAKAHQCVAYAVDRLLLPPLEQSVTVTLDLTW